MPAEVREAGLRVSPPQDGPLRRRVHVARQPAVREAEAAGQGGHEGLGGHGLEGGPIGRREEGRGREGEEGGRGGSRRRGSPGARAPHRGRARGPARDRQRIRGKMLAYGETAEKRPPFLF